MLVIVIPLFIIALYAAGVVLFLILMGLFWIVFLLVILLPTGYRSMRRALRSRRRMPRGRVRALRLDRHRPRARVRPLVRPRVRPQVQAASDIWPKWSVSHRRYMDRELALWQEQFDAVDSGK